MHNLCFCFVKLSLSTTLLQGQNETCQHWSGMLLLTYTFPWGQVHAFCTVAETASYTSCVLLDSQKASLGGHLSYLAHWVLMKRNYLQQTSGISQPFSSRQWQYGIPRWDLGNKNLWEGQGLSILRFLLIACRILSVWLIVDTHKDIFVLHHPAPHRQTLKCINLESKGCTFQLPCTECNSSTLPALWDGMGTP